MNQQKAKTLPTISLFSGIGGLDYGLEQAGFDIRLSVESDPDCRASLARQNRRLAEPGDIERLSPLEALHQAGLAPGELSLLAGGPPCQPFSKARQWSEKVPSMTDQRVELIHCYVSYIQELLPEVFVLENVPGFIKEGSGCDYLRSGLKQINHTKGTQYNLSIWTVNAAHYGVPQLRKRVFAIAHRNGLSVNQPPPTHGESDGLKPYATAWDAIWHLKDHNDKHLKVIGKWGELLPSIPEGKNYLYHTPRGDGEPLFGYRTRFWNFLLRLSKEKPSWTLPANPGPATGPFHWKGRKLSVKEMLKLQTFPEDYPVSSNYRKATRQVGNAVPPALGELIGRQIRCLTEHIELDLSLIPSQGPPLPGPEPTKRVPKHYLKNRKKHPDHPGEGKGPGALRRRQTRV